MKRKSRPYSSQVTTPERHSPSSKKAGKSKLNLVANPRNYPAMPESVLVTQSPESKKNFNKQSSMEMSLNDQSEPINLICDKS